jgi:hypothetical protein
VDKDVLMLTSVGCCRGGGETGAGACCMRFGERGGLEKVGEAER